MKRILIFIALLTFMPIMNISALSNNNYLKSIEIKDYNIDFNKDVLNYTLKIKSISSLEITAKAEDKDAIINIRGNSNLDNGSKIEIVVISADTTQRIYEINIVKEQSMVLKVVIIVLFLGLFMTVLAAFIWDKKEKKRNIVKELNLETNDNNRINLKTKAEDKEEDEVI